MNIEPCEWLHRELEGLPLIRFPFDPKTLPENGIYFFYEKGEVWGHGGKRPGIVRVGTHNDGNFQSRIAEHFLLNERKMDFDAKSSPPHDRSVFRKHIGRALLHGAGDSYLEIWNKDFMERENIRKFGHKRDIAKEKKIERAATEIIRSNFSFRFIKISEQGTRKDLEKRLIGTLAQCGVCQASPRWLGLDSPKKQIRESGLWLVQHLKASAITAEDRTELKRHIHQT
jgi:hypothetical protein